MASDGFPERPRGSPGEVEASAAQLRRAARLLEAGGARLSGSAGGLAGWNWRGMAADSYIAASAGLAHVCASGAETIDECAEALRVYGSELDSAQGEWDRARAEYEQARSAQQAAEGVAATLNSVVSAHPSQAAHLADQIDQAHSQAQAAGDSVTAALQHALQARERFDRAERHAISVLEGRSARGPEALGGPAPAFSGPVSAPTGAGGLGPLGGGFGIPLGGLGGYDGRSSIDAPENIQNGANAYYQDHVRGSVEPVDDIDTAVTFFAGGGLAAGGLKDLAEAGLRKLGGRLAAREGDGLLEPGPFAGRSIPARGAGRDFTREERTQIDEIMDETGCHRCGSKNPGTKSGHAVPDHQPPVALNPGPYELFPHCKSCSWDQLQEIARILRAERKGG